MTNSTMTSIRNSRLRSALRREAEKARREGREADADELLRRAIHAPVADGYFVGLPHAVKMVRMARYGRFPDGMSELRRQMWREIAAKVEERRSRLSRLDRLGESMVMSVARVLDSATASRFFISPNSAKKILTKISEQKS